MKKTLMILFCLSMSYSLLAQETVKQKEIGLLFSNLSNLDDFGLTFKTGTDKSLWRFNTLFISGNNMENTDAIFVNKQSNMGFGVAIGKEYRKNIVENLELRFGADLSFTYSQSKSESDDTTSDYNNRLIEQITYDPGVNLVFGLNYLLSGNFLIGAELLPNFRYTTGTSTHINNDVEVKSDISGFNYGLSNSSVLLSLSYRF